MAASETEPSNNSGAGLLGVEATTRWVLMLVCAAQALVVLDVSVMNVALPTIQAALGFGPVDLQWVSGAYALVFAGFLLLGGRLADRYGHRRVLIAGLALFGMTSLVGGMAAAPSLLVVARAAQGLGAAVLVPATLAILSATFPDGPQRTRAVAIWTAVSVAGGAIGNLIGGLLTQSVSWRAVLLVNVPIGALLVVLAHRVIPEDRQRAVAGSLDVPGAVAVTVGLIGLTYGISRVPDFGWNDLTTALALVTGLLALAAFAVIESRLARVPLLPARLLRDRAVWLGNILMLLAGACFQVPMWYFLTFCLRHVLGLGPLETGLGFLPHTLVTVLVGWRLTPMIMRYLEARTVIILGALVAAMGFAWQGQLTPDSDYLSAILGPAVVISVGAGMLNTPLTTTVLSGALPEDIGVVSGLMNTAKQIGGALGLAVLIPVTTGAARAMAPTVTTSYGRAFEIMAVLLIVLAMATWALPARQPRPGAT